MTLDVQDHDCVYEEIFNHHVFIIGFYIKQTLLKKIKYQTDGTFECLTISVYDNYHQVENFRYKDGAIDAPYKALHVNIPFDREIYDNADEKSRCNYFISLYKQGLGKAMEYKQLPYEQILNSLDELVRNKFTYCWNLRNMLIREWGLKICFDCLLDTNEYKMTATVYGVGAKKKEPLCKGTVIRTLPHEKHFDHVLSKKKCFLVVGNLLYICSNWQTKYFYFDLNQLKQGCFEIYKCQPSKHFINDAATFYSIQSKLHNYYLDISCALQKIYCKK